MPKIRVGEGESTSSLAKKNGFFWETIWNHPENAELKAKRKDPNVLDPDDMIFIPEKIQKNVSKGTEQEHVFTLKGEPCKIKLKMMKFGKPRANEKYTIELNGKITEGTTTGEGEIEHFIPGETATGQLIFSDGLEVYPLRVGHLNPIDTIKGVQQRLNNLGYMCGAEDGNPSDKLTEALKKFQSEYKLKESGEIDSATKAKLQELSK